MDSWFADAADVCWRRHTSGSLYRFIWNIVTTEGCEGIGSTPRASLEGSEGCRTLSWKPLKEHCSTEWNQLNIIPGYQPMSDGDHTVMSCDTIGRDGRDVTRHIWILMSSAKTNMSSQWTQQPLQLYLVSNSRSRFVWFKVSMLASASWNYWTEWSYRSARNVWEWSWMRPVNSRGNSDLIITKNNNCVLVFQHRSSNTRDAEM